MIGFLALTFTLSSLHKFLIGLRLGLWLGHSKTLGLFTLRKISVLYTGRTRVNWTELFTLQHFNTALTRVERSTHVETNSAQEVG